MVGGIDSVMESNALPDVFNLKEIDLISKNFWLIDVRDVASVEFDIDGTHHLMTVDAGDEHSSGNLDGVEISGDNCKQLYMRALYILVRGDTLDLTYAPAKYTVTINLKNGMSRVMQLCPANERQYAVVMDGEPARYYTSITDIEGLLDAIRTVKNGGDIPPL